MRFPRCLEKTVFPFFCGNNKLSDSCYEAVDDLYSYHEYQYGIEEYIETIGNENTSMKQQLEEASGELTSAQLALVGVYEMIGG